MKALALIASLSLSLLFSAGCQTGASTSQTDDGRITVNFDHPENFTDFRDGLQGTDRGREDYEYILRQAVRDEASRFLKDDEKLTVTFKDIDLAGDYLPSAPSGYDIRVVKEIYPPHMSLHFTLTDGSGTVIKEGDRQLTDLSFLQRVEVINRNEPLFHDKALLRDWIRREFR